MATTNWSSVDVDFGSSFYDVIGTEHGITVVGAEGTVYRRTASGGEFLTRGGVSGNSRNLRTIGATDGDRRIWFAGNSGAIGYYDFTSEELHDFSNPRGQGGTWRDIHVSGSAGAESVHIVDDSGQLVAITVDGTERTDVQLVKPLSAGSTLNGIDRDGDGRFYLVNSIGQLFTGAAVDDWTKTDLADTSLVDVIAGTDTVCTVTAGGTLLRYTPGDRSVDETDLGTGTLHDLDDAGGQLVASGAGGRTVRVTADGPTTEDTPASVTLYGLTAPSPTVAVGPSATIIERTKSKQGGGRSAESGGETSQSNE